MDDLEKTLSRLKTALFALIQALVRKGVLQHEDYLQSIGTASMAAHISGNTDRAELLLEHIAKMKAFFESGKDY